MKLPKTQAEAASIGSSKYQTGKACKHGHFAARWTLTSNCCQCTVDRGNARRDLIRAMLEEARAKSQATA